MRRFTELLKRFRRDESGAFLVIFALIAIVLIATSGAVVDFTYTQTARSRAQNALDAAALALQSRVIDVNNGTISKGDAEADVKSKAQQILVERLADSSISATVKSATIDTANSKLDISASITVPTSFVQLVGIHSLTAQLTSEAIRGSRDLEVSVALDVTQSMNMPSTKISALRTATGNLIDNLIQTSQTPTYSRMALVPYSYGVNVGSTYATTMRGTITGSTNITNATWATSTTTSISKITKANPGVVTVSSVSGLSNGDWVAITNVSGMTQVNKKAFKVANISTSNKTFQLANTNTNSYSNYSSGGTVTKCQVAGCEVTVTSASHGLAVNDKVYITGVKGMTQINISDINNPWTVDAVSGSTFVLQDSLGPSYSNYTSSGKAYCMKYGCTYLNFTNRNGDPTTFQASDGNDSSGVRYCVVERTDSEAFTDAAPTGHLFTIMYPSSTNNCVSKTIVPLTSSKTTLHDTADNLVAAGSTAGHIGLAWAWYMLSPNYKSIWPVAPADYKKNNLIKALILMTDGAFNTAYCSGVISKDSDTISGSSSMINCNAPNGDSITQAKALCTAIKSDTTGIQLFTVGFDIGTGDPKKDSADDKAAQEFLGGCATDSSHFYMAQSADDLDNAFKQIADKLNALRISK